MNEMDPNELTYLIKQGEGYNLEFKESFSDSISRDMCAFANANGGKILPGVSDSGEVRDMKITNKLKSPLITPPIQATQLETRILEQISENPKATKKEIAEKLQIKTGTVKEYLARLKKKKLVTRIGNTRTGQYKTL